MPASAPIARTPPSDMQLAELMMKKLQFSGSPQRRRPILLCKGPPPSQQKPKSLEIDMDLLDDMCRDYMPAGRVTSYDSVETIEHQLREASRGPNDAVIGQNPGASINLHAGSSQPVSSVSFTSLAMQPNGGAKVKAEHLRVLNSDSLEDMPTCCSLNSPNSDGQTPLTILAYRQDFAGVEYCCLFVRDGDSSLFEPLVEAAFQPSEDIFLYLLRKFCRRDDAEIPFTDRPIQGWKFLNAAIQEFEGRSLERALQRTRPARCELIRQAKMVRAAKC